MAFEICSTAVTSVVFSLAISCLNKSNSVTYALVLFAVDAMLGVKLLLLLVD